MGKIDRVQQRLADIGIGLARQRAEPGFDRIDAFGDAGEPAPPDHALDGPDLVFGNPGILIPDDNCGRAKAECDMACAEGLQGLVGIGGLVVCVRVEQRRRFVGEDFTQVRGKRPAFRKPVADIGVERLLGLRLVERQEPCHPAIGKAELI